MPIVAQKPILGSRKGNRRNIGSVGTTYQKVYQAWLAIFASPRHDRRLCRPSCGASYRHALVEAARSPGQSERRETRRIAVGVDEQVADLRREPVDDMSQHRLAADVEQRLVILARTRRFCPPILQRNFNPRCGTKNMRSQSPVRGGNNIR